MSSKDRVRSWPASRERVRLAVGAILLSWSAIAGAAQPVYEPAPWDRQFLIFGGNVLRFSELPWPGAAFQVTKRPGDPTPIPSWNDPRTGNFPSWPAALPPATQEYSNSLNVMNTGAQWAHVVGAMGSGVGVGVVDSGIFLHPEFAARVKPGVDGVPDGFSSSGLKDGRYDPDGHGTHVAGIIGSGVDSTSNNIPGTTSPCTSSKCNVGVAPIVDLYPVRVLDQNGSGYSSQISATVRSTGELPIRIYNMSFGGRFGSSSDLQMLQWINQQGRIAVVASGNESQKNPSYPARYATDASVAGSVVVVGAVDANNVMPTWSNKAGSTRNYYLVAPGVGVLSTVPDAACSAPPCYAAWSGTSMATPAVSGAAALVWGHWPWLVNKDVVQILLRSARDLGPAGVDSTYGWGLLDVKAAMSPIGTLTTTTTSGATLTLGQSLMAAPAAAGNASAAASAQVVYFDSFTRSFSVNASTLVAPARVSVATALPVWLESAVPVRQTTRIDGIRLAYQDSGAPSGGNYSIRSGSDHSYIVMFRGSGLVPFGPSQSYPFGAAFAGTDTLKNPYFALMESPAGFAVASEWAPGLSLKLGFIGGEKAGVSSSAAGIAEAAWRGGYLDVAVTGGFVNEQDAFLGGAGLALPSGNTRFLSLSASYALGSNLYAVATATRGRSEGATFYGDARLSAHTDAFSAGFVKEGAFSRNDRIGLAYSLPMRVQSGNATLIMPVSVVPETGAPVFGTVPIGLAPEGRERRLELTWATPLRNGSLGLSVMRRFEPGHDRTAPPETVYGARFSRRF